jgi:hypothetical protein
MLRRRSLLVAGCAAVGAALLLGAVLAAWELYLARELRHPLVVVAEDGILVRQGNGLSYPPRAATPVNRGVEGRLLFARGAWLKIELPGGEIGWVPRQVALIEHTE